MAASDNLNPAQYHKRIGPGVKPVMVNLVASVPNGTDNALRSHAVLLYNRDEKEKLQEIRPNIYGSDTNVYINRQLDALNRDVKSGEQQHLFKYTPPVSEHFSVESLSGTRSGRVHSMNLLGLAMNIANDYGVPLRPSRDLSKHSRPLVENLVKRGLVDSADLPTKKPNSITFIPENTKVNIEDTLYDHTQFSPEEVSRGKQTLRNLLRSDSSNKRLDHLSEQLKLF